MLLYRTISTIITTSTVLIVTLVLLALSILLVGTASGMRLSQTKVRRAPLLYLLYLFRAQATTRGSLLWRVFAGGSGSLERVTPLFVCGGRLSRYFDYFDYFDCAT